MAAALTPLGKRTVIDAFRPRPVRGLLDIGSRTAAAHAEYGLHTVAGVPRLTLQRLLGARARRTLHERAHGRDTQVVDPAPTPASISAEHRFLCDERDPAEHRHALLALGVTCALRYADQSSTRRSRTLPEATFHTVLLARRIRGVRIPRTTARPGALHRTARRCAAARDQRHTPAHP